MVRILDIGTRPYVLHHLCMIGLCLLNHLLILNREIRVSSKIMIMLLRKLLMFDVIQKVLVEVDLDKFVLLFFKWQLVLMSFFE